MGFGRTFVRKKREKRWVLDKRWIKIQVKKKDGFDSNGVSDLIREREKKDGFWTNSGIEICQEK